MNDRGVITSLSIGGETFSVEGCVEFEDRAAKALDGSIKHWENILNGDEEPGNGCSPCDMCDEYAEHITGCTVCDKCPLTVNGFGCCETGSVWKQYEKACQLDDNDCITELTLETRELAEQILANLRSLKR